MIDLAAAAGCAVVAGAGSLLVPRLIAPLPEPAPLEPSDDPADEPVEGDPPKEPYADIAALPGLAWKSAVVGALAGAVLGARLGWAWPLLYLLPLVPALVALALIDWRTHLLPTRLVWPLTGVTAGLVLVTGLAAGDPADLVRSGLGFLVAYGSFFLLWWIHPRGLGYGDVRLSGVLGLALGYLGWGELVTGLYAGFLLGGLGGGLLTLLKVVGRRAFPFGPFMVVGALAGVVWGQWVLDRLVTG